MAIVELISLLLWGQFWSIFIVLERGWRAKLTLASTAFLIIWSKFSSSRSYCFSFAKIKGFRLSRKYLSISDLVGAPTGLYFDKMNYKCFRWAAQSSTNLAWYWKSFLNLLQMLLATARSSPKFFLRNSLNSAHVIRIFSKQCLC